jgi:endonuclease-3 related protein
MSGPGRPRARPDPVRRRLLRCYRALLARFGPQRWWPGRSAFEIAVGAVLAQHTAWPNAARALRALRARGLLSPERLLAIPPATLARLIRPAGTYRPKARRLRAVARWLLHEAGGWRAVRRAPLAPLRRRLLAMEGIGPETADAILLYAAGRPVFVADAYTRRILGRHGLLGAGVGYERARAFLERHLPSDPALFNEFHALLVAVGKTHCGPAPRCAGCPLRFDLGGAGPRLASAPRRPGISRPPAAGRAAARPRRGRPGPARARPGP